MDVLLHSLSICECKTYPPPQKKYADTGTRTNVVCFRRVLLAGYARSQLKTTLLPYSSPSHMPEKINEV